MAGVADMAVCIGLYYHENGLLIHVQRIASRRAHPNTKLTYAGGTLIGAPGYTHRANVNMLNLVAGRVCSDGSLIDAILTEQPASHVSQRLSRSIRRRRGGCCNTCTWRESYNTRTCAMSLAPFRTPSCSPPFRLFHLARRTRLWVDGTRASHSQPSLVWSTCGTIPLSIRDSGHVETAQMEPFVRAVFVLDSQLQSQLEMCGAPRIRPSIIVSQRYQRLPKLTSPYETRWQMQYVGSFLMVNEIPSLDDSAHG